ncbi:Aldose reductase [Spironucleus salmonicida]|uniref:Aldose reductase n=1 Tax=Spironucleus salmonicida TaxID=348837 RepID=V6LI37_9EUKA|nr:Aldose reductase [Spironucleus salmonicida]|eukprot:EST43983.1 Aldose reductase [Spironucleus salmonicida]
MKTRIGLGTWRSEDQEAEQAVYNAIKIGYRYFDCAYEYGNEQGIGKGIATAIKNGLVQRNELFIATKLWQTHHKPEQVQEQLQLSLKNLQLEYLDLFIIHWPLQFIPGEDLYPRIDNQIQKDLGYTLQDTWRAMEQLVDKKLINYIGVSNYNVQLLQDLISYSKIKPHSNQIEVHPYLQQENLIKYCIQQNIIVTAYSPIGGKYDYGEHKNLTVQGDDQIMALSQKYNTTPVDVIISWHLQKYLNNYMVVPKSSNFYRLQQNFQPTLKLTTEDIQIINKLDKHSRLNDAAKVFWDTPVFE